MKNLTHGFCYRPHAEIAIGVDKNDLVRKSSPCYCHVYLNIHFGFELFTVLPLKDDPRNDESHKYNTTLFLLI